MSSLSVIFLVLIVLEITLFKYKCVYNEIVLNNFNNNPTMYHSKETSREGFNNFDNEYQSYESSKVKENFYNDFAKDNFFFNSKKYFLFIKWKI